MANSRIRDTLWILFGAAFFIAPFLLVLQYNQYGKSIARATFVANRLNLINQTRLALASAAEAEKSAVLAITDEDSLRYADQAREATKQAENARRQLQALLQQGGSAHEADLLEQFSKAFLDFQRIDKDLLALAVMNTNLKAYDLAFGPAQQAISDMDQALSNIVTKSADWPDSRNVALLAMGAQTAGLKIQTLFAPHIAQESDQKMDELETRMTALSNELQKDLDSLAAHAKLSGDPNITTAIAAFKRFTSIKKEILALSRENTNVRSLAISLTQKRRVMMLCQETLEALEQSIKDESAAGGSNALPTSPR